MALPARVHDETAPEAAHREPTTLHAQTGHLAFLQDVFQLGEVVQAPHEPSDDVVRVAGERTGLGRRVEFLSSKRVETTKVAATVATGTAGRAAETTSSGVGAASLVGHAPSRGAHGAVRREKRRRGSRIVTPVVRARLARLARGVERNREHGAAVGTLEKPGVYVYSFRGGTSENFQVVSARERRHGHEIVPAQARRVAAERVAGETPVRVAVYALLAVRLVHSGNAEHEPARTAGGDARTGPGRQVARHFRNSRPLAAVPSRARAERRRARRERPHLVAADRVDLLALQAQREALGELPVVGVGVGVVFPSVFFLGPRRALVRAQSKRAVSDDERRRHHLLRLDHHREVSQVLDRPREPAGQVDRRRTIGLTRCLAGRGRRAASARLGFDDELGGFVQEDDPRLDDERVVHQVPVFRIEHDGAPREVAPAVRFLATAEPVPAVAPRAGFRNGVGCLVRGIRRPHHRQLVAHETLPVRVGGFRRRRAGRVVSGALPGRVHLQVRGDVPRERHGVSLGVDQQSALAAAHGLEIAPHLPRPRLGEVRQRPPAHGRVTLAPAVAARGGVRGARGGGDLPGHLGGEVLDAAGSFARDVVALRRNHVGRAAAQ